MAKTAEELAKEAEAEEAAKKAEDDKKKADEEKNKSRTLSFEEHQKAVNDVVAEREKFKEKYRETREKLATIEKRLDGIPSSEELQKILEEKKSLEDYKKKTDEEAEAKRLEKASDIEKLQLQLDKLKSSYEAALANKEDEKVKTTQQLSETLDRKSKEVDRLLSYRKESEILKAAEKAHAVKPSQIVDMLSNKFIYDEELGEFVYPIINAKGRREGEKDVATFIKEFLEDPENDNLVKADMAGGGSGHHKNPLGSSGKSSDTSNKYLRSERAILEEEAEERGMKVEDWIIIKKKQEDLKANKDKK